MIISVANMFRDVTRCHQRVIPICPYLDQFAAGVNVFLVSHTLGISWGLSFDLGFTSSDLFHVFMEFMI